MPILFAPPPPAEVTTEPAGLLAHTLTTADGTVWDLSGDPDRVGLEAGWRGFDSPTYQLYTSDSPGFDGEEFEGARAQARDLLIPIYLRADTLGEFLTRKRDLLSAMAPKRGPVTLTVAEPDGARRRIDCYYTGRGGEGDTSTDRAGLTWVKHTLELRALQPYWRGDLVQYTFGNPSGGSFFPILPLRVTTSRVFGTSTIVVPGDTDTYPIWTVTGPSTGSIELRFTTPAGEERGLSLGSVITAGQWVRADTTPTRPTVVDETGANRYGDLGPGSGLWPMPPGPVEVEVNVAGATADTLVTLQFEPRYETA